MNMNPRPIALGLTLSAAIALIAVGAFARSHGGHGGHGGGPTASPAAASPSTPGGAAGPADAGTNVYAYDPAAVTYCGAWTGDSFCKAGLVLDNNRSPNARK